MEGNGVDIVPGTLGQMIYTTQRARSGWRRDVLILLVKMELSWCRVHHVSDLVSQKSTHLFSLRTCRPDVGRLNGPPPKNPNHTTSGAKMPDTPRALTSILGSPEGGISSGRVSFSRSGAPPLRGARTLPDKLGRVLLRREVEADISFVSRRTPTRD